MNDALLDLESLGLDRGGHLLLKHALRSLPDGASLGVRGTDPALAVHLRAWCRAAGHAVEWSDGAGTNGVIAWIRRSEWARERWADAERAGSADPRSPEGVLRHPPQHWGLAARGAAIERGGPEFEFALADKDVVWADEAPRIYAQAAAAQWDPATAIDWTAPIEHPEEVEDAVVQVMTYLIENETAALLVPARFLAQVHPHFREVLQVLAVQAADEARHIEVFTRRALLRRAQLGLSTTGGQASLQTLLQEPDFALAFFLLSVLGEGSFLSLLWFVHEHGPDPVTRQVARLAAQDEARHVAFGLAHLSRHLGIDPDLRPRLAAAVERRHESLRRTAGLNEEVFEALVLLAAGAWAPGALAQGHEQVARLKQEMDEGRRARLVRLGFADAEAAVLSGLHTRNFM